QIFHDHVAQRRAWLIFSVAAAGEALGIEVGLAAQLYDALGDAVGMGLLFAGVLKKLGLDRLRIDAFGHVVMPFVAQHAHDLGGQRFVEQLQHRVAVGVVAGSDRAVFHVLARPVSYGLDVGNKALGFLVGSIHVPAFLLSDYKIVENTAIKAMPAA